jgi:hypothetical protein
MSRRKFPIALIAAALAVTSVILASPAGAVVDSCATAGSGGISMFPNTPAGQSNLKVSCTLTTADGFASHFYKTEDFPQAVWHFGGGRQVTGNTTSGSPNIVLTAGHFASTDVNHPISGFASSASLNACALPPCTPATNLTASGLPAYVFIKTFTDATHAVLSANATGTFTGRKWTLENTDSRTVTDATTTSGSGVVTSPTANFQPSDVGRTITGTNMAHGAKITVRTSATQVTVAPVATAGGTSSGCATGQATCQPLSIGPATNQTTARTVHDGHTTTSSTTLTSASASFQSWDKDLPITGAGIPAGDYIKTVTNATTVVLNAAATATSATAALVIGQPNATAPTNGDTALNLGAELDLSPSLVAGSDACGLNTPEGFDITGGWLNPGSFVSGLADSSTDVSLNKPVIGELAVPTAVVTFNGYVEQVPASTAGESVTAAHYDVVFPFLPTALALCNPGTAGIASTFNNLAVAHSQTANLPTGVGAPSDAQMRALKDISTASVSSTAFLHIRASNTSTTDTFMFSKACTENYPGISDFGCGDG